MLSAHGAANEEHLDLLQLSTPRQRWVTVQLGPIEPCPLTALECQRFDQAPVVDASGAAVGVVLTDRLRVLANAGASLEAQDVDQSTPLPRFLSVPATLAALADRRAALVRSTEGSWALLSLSDLNKHAFRAHLYAKLAELELIIAGELPHRFQNPFIWIERLGLRQQVNVLGNWEVAKRNNVDVGPEAAMPLGDLVDAFSHSSDACASMGLSQKQFRALAHSAVALRNKVMHPVRFLVVDPPSVAELHQTYDKMERLLRLLAALRERREDMTDHAHAG